MYMDLTSILGSIPGAASLLGSLGDMAGLKAAAAAKLGISTTALDEFETEAKAILADGKITPAEIEGRIAALAESKGIPAEVVQMALKMMGQQASPSDTLSAPQQ